MISKIRPNFLQVINMGLGDLGHSPLSDSEREFTLLKVMALAILEWKVWFRAW